MFCVLASKLEQSGRLPCNTDVILHRGLEVSKFLLTTDLIRIVKICFKVNSILLRPKFLPEVELTVTQKIR